jgi:predicted XRE-type DNA-binding protein
VANIAALLGSREGIPENQKKVLTEITELRKTTEVKTLASLIERIKQLTSPIGMKGKLAKALGVPQPRVSEWLSGKTEPGGETTLRLLAWATAHEDKPKSPGRALTQPEPKAQLRNPSYETTKSGRKKR